MNRFQQAIPVSALALLLLVGCGGSGGPGGVAVSGKVTLDSQPLAEGTITFVPQGTTPGQQAASGPIENGAYAIRASSGPSPGSYRVEIHATKKTGKQVPDRDGEAGAMMDEVLSLIPERYNVKSTLTSEVKADGATPHDFALDGNPDARASRKGQ